MRALLAWVSCLCCLGCSVSDLGQPCVLSRSNPDGGAALTVTEGDLPAGDGFVGGAAVCDGTVCVRDSSITPASDPAAPAAGYCSRGCTADSDCGGGYRCLAFLPSTVTAGTSFCFRGQVDAGP